MHVNGPNESSCSDPPSTVAHGQFGETHGRSPGASGVYSRPCDATMQRADDGYDALCALCSECELAPLPVAQNGHRDQQLDDEPGIEHTRLAKRATTPAAAACAGSVRGSTGANCATSSC